MKWLSVIAKNLKLLFRSKESAFTIIVGPLLIILLVSAAYTGGDTDTTVRVGTVASQYTSLADEVVTALKEKGYQVSTFTDAQECIDLIKTGALHTCIQFPDDFRVKENASNEVTFSVDYSRINLVYQIIDGLGKEFSLQNAEISKATAGNLLDRVALAQQEISEQIETAATIDKNNGALMKQLTAGRQELSSVDVNVSFIDLLQIRGRVNGLNTMLTDVKSEATTIMGEMDDATRHMRTECDNCSDDLMESLDNLLVDIDNATVRIDSIADDAPKAVQEVTDIVDNAARSMQLVERRFGDLVNASQNVDEGLSSSMELLNDTGEKLTTIRGKLQHLDDGFRSSLGLSAVGVSSPITTKIEAINTEHDNLTFTYPYVLLLVIMFLGLMLNSTLIVMDKTSKAAFRNFTTATRDEYHIMMSFITTFIILFVQTLIILLISYYFVQAPLFNNFSVSLIIIAFSITLFSFLGMIIGYLAGTQEAAMIASLSIGSVFLFISNLVLPLEAMNTIVQTLSKLNPYVVLSELLKQSMLFDMRLSNVPGKLGLVAGAIILLFLLILAVQRSFKRRYFQRRSKDLASAAFAKQRSAKPLLVGDRQVRDLFDLLETLDNMTRADFEKACATGKHPISAWVRDELGEKRLARRLHTTSKERIILALDKHLKRQTKRLQKQR